MCHIILLYHQFSQETHINVCFSEIRIIWFSDAFFAEKKPPEGAPPASTRGLEASNHLVWSHPITLRSLVVKHTAWTQNWTNFNTFDTFSPISKNTICSKKFHINDLELSFGATFAESRCTSFPCWNKTLIFMIFQWL